MHTDIDYVLVRSTSKTEDSVFIIAAERLSALTHVAGEVEVLAIVKGIDLQALVLTYNRF